MPPRSMDPFWPLLGLLHTCHPRHADYMSRFPDTAELLGAALRG